MLGSSVKLRDHAKNEAAILIQSHWRRVLASQRCHSERVRRKERHALAQALVVKTAGERVECPLDQLTVTVDSIYFVEERIPFLHATSSAAEESLVRSLSYAPGCTLRWRNAEDMKPSRLREALMSCLYDGSTLVIDMDTGSHGHHRELTDSEVLFDICGPNHFPEELFKCPRSILKPEIYGPLRGRVGAKALEHFELLELSQDASLDEVRKAYKNLIRTAHPDKGGDPEKFLKIQEAYAALTLGGSDDLPDMPDFSPQASFKLLLVSRLMDAPPAEMDQYCTPVWVSDKMEHLLKGYGKEVQTKSVQSFDDPIGLAATCISADYWHAEFMKNRVYEDDELEVNRRVRENQVRVLKHRRRLRRNMFLQVANLPKSEDDKAIEAEQSLELSFTEARKQLQYVEEAISDEVRLAKIEHDAINELKQRITNEEHAKTAAQDQLPGLQRQAASKKGRIPLRQDALKKKREAAAAKQAEAQKAIGQKQEELEREAADLREAVDQAEAMQNQFEEWVKRLESEAKGIEQDIERHSAASYDLRQQLRQKDSELTKMRLKRQGELLEMTDTFWRESQAIAQEKLQQSEKAAAEAKDAEWQQLRQASLQQVHRAVYMMDEGNSKELVDAAADNDFDEVLVLLGKGFDLESHDSNGFTVLSEAACCGSKRIVELLLELGADPNTYATTESSKFYRVLRTPLWRAQFNGHYDIMKLLLEHGGDATCLDANPNTSLEAKAVLGPWNAERVQQAQVARRKRLENQLDEFSKLWSEEDARALHVTKAKRRLQELVIKGNAEGVKALLQQCVTQHATSGFRDPPLLSAEIRDRLGRTLLHLAAWTGKVNVVEMLVTHWKAAKGDPEDPHGEITQQVFKVDIDARFGPWNGCHGWTALSVAAFCGHAEVVEVLRLHGANPLLGTGFHKDAFAIAEIAPAPASVACAVVQFIDDDNVVHTSHAHGFRSGEEVMYRCEAYSETPMRLILPSSKMQVSNFSHFCVHVLSPTSLTLHKVGKTSGLVPRGPTLQRVYSGKMTTLQKVAPAQMSMREYLPALTNAGMVSSAGFLCDRQPIRASGRNQKILQDSRKRQDLETARVIDSACNKRSSNAAGRLVPLGSWVQLSHKGQEVEEDYDWSRDPLRPGEEGEVIDPDDYEWDEEHDPSEVCVLGPRGDVSAYDPSDLVLISSASPVCKPSALGPSRSIDSSERKAEITDQHEPWPQDRWISERRLVKSEDSSFYELKYLGSFEVLPQQS